MLNVQTISINYGLDRALWTPVLIALVADAAFAACRSAPFWRWFSAAATASLLVSPHVYAYDATLLLLPLLLAIFRSQARFTRIAAVAAVTPIPYLLMVFGPRFWSVPPLVLMIFLAALALKSYRSRARAVPALKPLPPYWTKYRSRISR